MEPDEASDWAKLGNLAFRRQERSGELFKRLLALQKADVASRLKSELDALRKWMLVPLTLWPIDIAGLVDYVCSTLERKKTVDSRLIFILDQLRELPSEEAQKAISEYEKFVEKGDYDPLIRSDSKCKYSLHEAELLKNPKIHEEWASLKNLFDVDKFRDKKGIIRRRMAQERNFRNDWAFKWQKMQDRFQTAFDAFCHRWHLYGMENDTPLLLKLTVNPTAHGLMIVIPTFWSFDLKRDLDAKAISKLHKSRGALRQGPKMSENRLQHRQQARQAHKANQEAKANGLRGVARIEFIRKKVRLSQMFDERSLRRLIKEGSAL